MSGNVVRVISTVPPIGVPLLPNRGSSGCKSRRSKIARSRCLQKRPRRDRLKTRLTLSQRRAMQRLRSALWVLLTLTANRRCHSGTRRQLELVRPIVSRVLAELKKSGAQLAAHSVQICAPWHRWDMQAMQHSTAGSSHPHMGQEPLRATET